MTANPLFDTLLAQRLSSDAPFLIAADGAVTTYAEFLAEAGRASQALESFGVRPGDRVAVQTAKSARQLALYVACLARGVVYLPLNTAYTPTEIQYFLEDAEPSLAVVDPAAVDGLAGAVDRLGARLTTLDAAGAGGLSEAMAGQRSTLEPVARGADDLAAILYTSGTTGRAKGAMLTQGNLLSNALTLRDLWRFTAEDRLLHALPTFHAHGLFVACNTTLAAGGALIFLPSFNAEEVVSLLPRATAMMGVPTFYTRLLGRADFDQAATRSIRLFISGSAPLLAETHRVFEARTGHRILERYGMTETGMNASNPYDGDRRPGSVGPPLPGVEIRITDPGDAVAKPQGEIGMVEVRGPNVFQGYWRMPEKTAEELRPDGWFITGDLGEISEDGYLTIVGRGKDLVISGGYNVYPREVELAIDAIPGVRESAVIGAPHPDFGEGVVAVVVRDEGGEVDGPAIKAALGDCLAKFKQPKEILFADALPRNTMGKVQKAALRETHKGLFGMG